MQDFQQQLSSFGWTADAVERQVKEIRARHSHQAGVSMAYLLRDFVQLAQEKSGEVDPTFLRLKEVFWLADHKLGQDRYTAHGMGNWVALWWTCFLSNIDGSKIISCRGVGNIHWASCCSATKLPS